MSWRKLSDSSPTRASQSHRVSLESQGLNESKANRSLQNRYKRPSSSSSYQDVTAKERKRISRLTEIPHDGPLVLRITSNGEETKEKSSSENQSFIPQEKKTNHSTHSGKFSIMPSNYSKNNSAAKPLFHKLKQQTQVIGRNINSHSKKKCHVFNKDGLCEANTGKQKQSADFGYVISSDTTINSKKISSASDLEKILKLNGSQKQQKILVSYKIPKKRSNSASSSGTNDSSILENSVSGKHKPEAKSTARRRLDEPKNRKRGKQKDVSDEDEEWTVSKRTKRKRSTKTQQFSRIRVVSEDSEDDSAETSVASVSDSSKDTHSTNEVNSVEEKQKPYTSNPNSSVESKGDAPTDPNEEPSLLNLLSQEHTSAKNPIEGSTLSHKEHSNCADSVNTCVETTPKHTETLVQAMQKYGVSPSSAKWAADILKPQNNSSPLDTNGATCSNKVDPVPADDFDDDIMVVEVVKQEKKIDVITLDDDCPDEQSQIVSEGEKHEPADTQSLCISDVRTLSPQKIPATGQVNNLIGSFAAPMQDVYTNITPITNVPSFQPIVPECVPPSYSKTNGPNDLVSHTSSNMHSNPNSLLLAALSQQLNSRSVDCNTPPNPVYVCIPNIVKQTRQSQYHESSPVDINLLKNLGTHASKNICDSIKMPMNKETDDLQKQKACEAFANLYNYVSKCGLDAINNLQNCTIDSSSLLHGTNVSESLGQNSTAEAVSTTNNVRTLNSDLNVQSTNSHSNVQETLPLLQSLFRVNKPVPSSQAETVSSDSAAKEKLDDHLCTVCKRRQSSFCSKCRKKCCYNKFCIEKHSAVCKATTDS